MTWKKMKRYAGVEVYEGKRNKKYRFRYRDSTSKQRVFSSYLLADVLNEQIKINTMRDTGQIIHHTNKLIKNEKVYTVGDIFQKLVDDYPPGESTLKDYKLLFKNHLSRFAGMDIRDFNNDVIKSYYKNVPGNSKRHIYALAKRISNIAYLGVGCIEKLLINEFGAPTLDPPKEANIFSNAVIQDYVGPFLFGTGKSKDGYYISGYDHAFLQSVRLPLIVQLSTGMRPEGIIGLTWESIQWDDKEIHCRRFYKTKLKDFRTLPKEKKPDIKAISNGALDALREEWIAQGKPDEGHVFFSKSKRHNGSMYLYSGYKAGLEKLCNLLGLDVVKPHGIRHTFSGRFRANGGSLDELRDQFNHSSTKTTMRYVRKDISAIQSKVLDIDNFRDQSVTNRDYLAVSES